MPTNPSNEMRSADNWLFVNPQQKILTGQKVMDFNAWMDTLYGWAPTAMKPKNSGAHAMNSGFSALHAVGMITNELHTGNIIELESRATGGLLRVHNRTGKVDFYGIHGKQAQFLVQCEGENVVTL